jgi:hypothetical protein
MTRYVLAVLAAGIWINLCEFLRNQWLLMPQWMDKYESLGMPFPSAPVNGVMWGVWGFVLAACIVSLSRRLTFLHTFVVSWIIAFLLMWIVVWNLNVLPLGVLPVAVPWSMIEIAGAVFIAKGIAGKKKVGS